tara:strand:+ start:74 stop:337 length:264 start_codon:yes stop_codon:yes gene_type:complete
MKKSEFRTLIREQIKRTLREEEEVKAKPEQKDASTVSDSPLMDRINTRAEWEQLIGDIMAMEVTGLTSFTTKKQIIINKLKDLEKNA